MELIIVYCIVSILIIGIIHYLYISLQELNESEIPRVVDLKSENEKRELIMVHLKEEERETNELESYLKEKLSN
jgi:hypothetical protein